MKFHEAMKAVTENPHCVFKHTVYERDYYLHTDLSEYRSKIYFQIHVLNDEGLMGECPASWFNDNFTIDSEWVAVKGVGY